jgi:hypothetical protein
LKADKQKIKQQQQPLVQKTTANQPLVHSRPAQPTSQPATTDLCEVDRQVEDEDLAQVVPHAAALLDRNHDRRKVVVREHLMGRGSVVCQLFVCCLSVVFDRDHDRRKVVAREHL